MPLSTVQQINSATLYFTVHTHCFILISEKESKKIIPIFPKLNNLIGGHYNITSYLYRIGKTDNRQCPFEDEEQTIDHLIFKCKIMRNQRNEKIRNMKENVGNWPSKDETPFKNY